MDTVLFLLHIRGHKPLLVFFSRGGKIREIPFAMDIIFAGGKFSAKLSCMSGHFVLVRLCIIKQACMICLMIRTSCIRRPCITERRMQCYQVLNTSVVIYVYKLCNPTVAVFYSSQLWDLSNNCIDTLSISWRKSIIMSCLQWLSATALIHPSFPQCRLR